MSTHRILKPVAEKFFLINFSLLFIFGGVIASRGQTQPTSVTVTLNNITAADGSTANGTITFKQFPSGGVIDYTDTAGQVTIVDGNGTKHIYSESSNQHFYIGGFNYTQPTYLQAIGIPANQSIDGEFCDFEFLQSAFLTGGTVQLPYSTDFSNGNNSIHTSHIVGGSVTFSPTAALTITTTSLPDAVSGQTYSYQLQATGGTGMLTWKGVAPSGASLPAGGIDLSSSGVLSFTGTQPVAPKLLTFTFTVTDATHATATKQLTLAITGVTIDRVRMSDDHTLEVDVTATFGSDGSTSKSVEISTNLNGKQLDKALDGGLLYTFPHNTQGVQQEPFFIDLGHEGVPYFSSNQNFSIKATIKEGNISSLATKSAVILLPVILVPGIDPIHGRPQGGKGSFPLMENYLVQQSKANLASQNLLGDGYSLSTGDMLHDTYATLYTLSYDRNNASLAQGARSLADFCNQIQLYTYADAVNIVAHSKGGLISRQFVVTQSNTMHVNSFVMCMTPNLGSLWARYDALGVGDYSNLYPLWPWLRRSLPNGVTTPYIMVTPNPQLALLNTVPLPSSLKVTNIWSGSIATHYTNTLSIDDGQVSTIPSYVVGDFIVPAFSQRGLISNPNNPNAPQALIPAFQNANITEIQVSGSHATGLPNPLSSAPGGFDIPEVQQHVLETVMAGTSL